MVATGCCNTTTRYKSNTDTSELISLYLNNSTWNFERDEIISKNIYMSHGIVNYYFNRIKYEENKIDSIFNNEITLSASELKELISNVLMGKKYNDTSIDVTVTKSVESNNYNWGISESNNDKITTDWVKIKGKESGVLWWKKEFDTEVRHVITITKSDKFPVCTNFSISTQVRERPNANYAWTEANVELGYSSFKELKNSCLLAIKHELSNIKGKNEN